MRVDAITGEEFFVLLGALLESRRAAFKTPIKIAFAVVEDGAWVLDTEAPQLITRGFRDDLAVSVLSNRRTLSDLIRGAFDPMKPGPEHLFLWGGDREALLSLGKALGGGMSAFSAQLAALRR